MCPSGTAATVTLWKMNRIFSSGYPAARISEICRCSEEDGSRKMEKGQSTGLWEKRTKE